MCPLCIAAAVTIGASATSAGGLTALVMNKFRANEGAKKSQQKQNQKEEEWEK